TEEGVTLREAVTRLDTIRLFPNKERGILIFRGVLKVREDDAADVLHLLAACESMDDPKPALHYRTILAERLDKKRAYRVALRDRDLMPPPEGPGAVFPPGDPIAEMTALLKREGFRRSNQRRKKERQVEEVKEKLRAQGLDPDEYI